MLQVVRTRMAFRRAMQRTLKKNNAGITFEMLQVLSSLWHEQGISQQILAERIAKDKACLTNLMNNLEKKGYVCRKGDPTDRRNKLVFLTPEGEEFKNQIVHMHISDNNAQRDCVPPGKGTFDYNKMKNILESANYQGVYMTEIYSLGFDVEKELRESKAYLETI